MNQHTFLKICVVKYHLSFRCSVIYMPFNEDNIFYEYFLSILTTMIFINSYCYEFMNHHTLYNHKYILPVAIGDKTYSKKYHILFNSTCVKARGAGRKFSRGGKYEYIHIIELWLNYVSFNPSPPPFWGGGGLYIFPWDRTQSQNKLFRLSFYSAHMLNWEKANENKLVTFSLRSSSFVTSS